MAKPLKKQQSHCDNETPPDDRPPDDHGPSGLTGEERTRESTRRQKLHERLYQRYLDEIESGLRVECQHCGHYELSLPDHDCTRLRACVDCGGPGDVFIPDPDLYSINDFSAGAAVSMVAFGVRVICDSCEHARQLGLQRGGRVS